MGAGTWSFLTAAAAAAPSFFQGLAADWAPGACLPRPTRPTLQQAAQTVINEAHTKGPALRKVPMQRWQLRSAQAAERPTPRLD